MRGTLQFYPVGLRARCFKGVSVVLTKDLNTDHVEYISIGHHSSLRLRTYFLTRWSDNALEFESPEEGTRWPNLDHTQLDLSLQH